jgi:hypothetical protein
VAAPLLSAGTNARRSATGNTSAASDSGNWWSIPEILVTLGGLSGPQVAQVMPVVLDDPRIPDNLTVFYNPHHPGELAHHISEPIATNGKGIDHSDGYRTRVFDALFEDVGIALGG